MLHSGGWLVRICEVLRHRIMLLLSMRSANVMLGWAAVGLLPWIAVSGCSRAESQTTATNQPIASPIYSNSMANFQKPATSELKQKLTSMQYEVTQHAATEPAFRNDFWDNKKPG